MIPPSLGQAMARIESIEGLLDRLSEVTPTTNQGASGSSFEALLSAQLHANASANPTTGAAAAAAMQAAGMEAATLGLGSGTSGQGGQASYAQSMLNNTLSSLAGKTAGAAASSDLDLTPAPADIKQLAIAAAQRYGVDPALVLSVINTESDFNTRCTSSAGAMGLMQLMPENCTEYGVSNPYDAAENIDGGVRHLRDMIRTFNGDLRLALAGYNAGPNAVKRYGGIPPYRETQNYVRKVLGSLPYYQAETGTQATSLSLGDASSSTLAGLVGRGLNAAGSNAGSGVSPSKRLAAAQPEGKPAADAPIPTSPMVPLTPMTLPSPMATPATVVAPSVASNSGTVSGMAAGAETPAGVAGLTTRMASAPQPLAGEPTLLPPTAAQVEAPNRPVAPPVALTPLDEPQAGLLPESGSAINQGFEPVEPSLGGSASPSLAPSGLPSTAIIEPTANFQQPATEAASALPTAPDAMAAVSAAAATTAETAPTPALRFVSSEASVQPQPAMAMSGEPRPMPAMDIEVTSGTPAEQPVADDAMARWIASGGREQATQPTQATPPAAPPVSNGTVAPAAAPATAAQPSVSSQPSVSAQPSIGSQPSVSMQPSVSSQPMAAATGTADASAAAQPPAVAEGEAQPAESTPRPLTPRELAQRELAQREAAQREAAQREVAPRPATMATAAQPSSTASTTSSATTVATQTLSEHVSETFGGAEQEATGALATTPRLAHAAAAHLAPVATTPAGQSAETTLAQVAEAAGTAVHDFQSAPTEERRAEEEPALASTRVEQANRPRPMAPAESLERPRTTSALDTAAANDAPATPAVAATQPGTTGGQSSHSDHRQVATPATGSTSATGADGATAPAFSLMESTRTSATSAAAQPEREVAARDLSEMTAHVAGRARLVRTPGHDEFTVRLELPEVGQVAVRIVRDSTGVAVNLQTGSDSLRRALQDQMPHLESALREQGVQMSSFSTGDGGEGRQDAYQSWFGQQAGSGQQHQPRGEASYLTGQSTGSPVEATADAADSTSTTNGPAARGETSPDRGFSHWA